MKKYSLVSLVVLSFVFCSLLLCSCKKTQEPPPTDTKLKVAATIFAIADITRNIGGDKVTVITILPPGASPHTFEPTYDTIQHVTGIRALFKIGNGLDDWAQKVIEALSGNITVIEVSKSITLRHFEDGTTDPHYWLSLANGSIIAKNVADSLATLDPANKDYYMTNLAAYQQLLTKEDEAIKTKLAGLKDKTFVTFHEAWFYFAQAYGLKVAEAFEPFPGKEPTPEFMAHFAKVITQTDRFKPRGVFSGGG